MRRPSDAVLRIAASALLIAAATVATAAELTATHGDWKVYRHGDGAELMCFAVATPSGRPAGPDSRAKPHAYVTVWSRSTAKPEVSVLMGFPLKRGASIAIEIGDDSFSLTADGDRAFAGNEREEARLIESMRAGQQMTVASSEASGGRARDTYSLQGITAALNAIVSACR